MWMIIFIWLKIDGYPTMLLFKGGEIIDEYNGDRSLDDFYEFVSSHVKNLSPDEL